MSHICTGRWACSARGAAYIGSHNFFDTSLEDNREVGVLLRDGDGISELRRDFAQDWQAAALSY
jgi:phosphatidylserine/phosphatidylglycerophosphate/cardiolipin synthase-like enzyme